MTLHFVYVFTFHFHYTDRQLWFSYQTKATPLSFTTYKDVEQLNGEMSFAYVGKYLSLRGGTQRVTLSKGGIRKFDQF